MSPDVLVAGQKMRGKRETKKDMENDKHIKRSRWRPIERESHK